MKNNKDILPFEICQSILNRNGKHYSEEQLKEIRSFIVFMIESSVQSFERMKFNEAKIIRLTENKQDKYDKTESIPLCKSEYRRAG